MRLWVNAVTSDADRADMLRCAIIFVSAPVTSDADRTGLLSMTMSIPMDSDTGTSRFPNCARSRRLTGSSRAHVCAHLPPMPYLEASRSRSSHLAVFSAANSQNI